MRDFEETDGWDNNEGQGYGDGASVSRFDPLFSPWEALSEEAIDLRGTRTGGTRFAPKEAYTWRDPSAPLSASVDDWLTWEAVPPVQRTTIEEAAHYRPPESRPLGETEERPSSWYATHWDETWGPGMTEAQRRLREGVITIPRPERRWTVTVREVAETVLLALLIFLSVRASFQNFKVEGVSMSPSLEDGEYLIVNKLSYAQVDLSLFNFLPFFEAGDNPVQHLWGEPSRGDVIVFRAPTSPDRDFIKRIIGTPGDTLEITPEGVKVNGTLLREPYVTGATNCNGECMREVPAADTPESQDACQSDRCYFVMGDNRQNSSDSRQGWLVPEENIIGKALITYWHHGSPELELAPNHGVSADQPE